MTWKQPQEPLSEKTITRTSTGILLSWEGDIGFRGITDCCGAYPTKTVPTATTMTITYTNADTTIIDRTKEDASEAFSYGCDIDESNNEYHASESEFERGGASDYFSESATESLNFASTVATAPSLLSGMSSTNTGDNGQQQRPKRKKKRGKPKVRNTADTSDGAARPRPSSAVGASTRRRSSKGGPNTSSTNHDIGRPKRKSSTKTNPTVKRAAEIAVPTYAQNTDISKIDNIIYNSETTDNDASNSRRRVRTRRKKSSKSAVKNSTSLDDSTQGDNQESQIKSLEEEFNASTLNAGLSMDSYVSESFTEGETDPGKQRPRRRKRNVTRTKSRQSHTSSRSGSRSRSRSRSRSHSRSKSRNHTMAPGNRASDTDGTTGPRTKRNSKVASSTDRTTNNQAQQREAMDDESIQWESLATTTTRTISTANNMSASSLEKEASLDLAKHNPSTPSTRRKKNPHLVAAMSQSASGLHRGRSLSPGTQKRNQEALLQRRNTITYDNITTTAAGENDASPAILRKKTVPRRLKSHDGAPISGTSRPKKPIRRAKSDGGPDPAGSSRDRTRSRSRSRSKSRSQSKSRRLPSKSRAPHQGLKKERSQSLNLGVVERINTNKRGKNARPSAPNPSPSGKSRASLGMSINTMDQSLMTTQSLPYNSSRAGPSVARRGSNGSQTDLAPPKRSKSADAKAKTTKKKSVNRVVSKDAKKPGVRKKKNGTNSRRPSGSASKNPGTRIRLSESFAVNEDDSLASNTPSLGTSLGAANSVLTGHIAKDSQGRNNLPLRSAPSADNQRAEALISPFSTRSRDPSLFMDDVPTVYSGGSSVAPSVASNASKFSKTSGASAASATNGAPHHQDSTVPNTAIGSYFDRTGSSQDVFAEKSLPSSRESVSMASTRGGSLLSDYTKSSSESKASQGRKKGDPGRNHDSISNMSSEAVKTISPFSTRAGLESSHTKVTGTGTEHTNATPLIPDSDDEDGSSSFHAEVPVTVTSKVESPPPTPNRAPKVQTSKPSTKKKKGVALAPSSGKKLAPSKNEAATSTKGEKTMKQLSSTSKPPLRGSVNSVRPKAEKPVFNEFEDPVPRKRVENKSFWRSICCKSAGAVD